jgi:hypothetical protein
MKGVKMWMGHTQERPNVSNGAYTYYLTKAKMIPIKISSKGILHINSKSKGITIGTRVIQTHQHGLT